MAMQQQDYQPGQQGSAHPGIPEDSGFPGPRGPGTNNLGQPVMQPVGYGATPDAMGYQVQPPSSVPDRWGGRLPYGTHPVGDLGQFAENLYNEPPSNFPGQQGYTSGGTLVPSYLGYLSVFNGQHDRSPPVFQEAARRVFDTLNHLFTAGDPRNPQWHPEAYQFTYPQFIQNVAVVAAALQAPRRSSQPAAVTNQGNKRTE